jgi:hypothetical protein
MPNRSSPDKPGRRKYEIIPPKEEILALLSNCRDLAVSQNLTAARDALRATKIVSEGFGYDLGHVFMQLDEAILSKPVMALSDEFIRAAMVIKAAVKST